MIFSPEKLIERINQEIDRYPFGQHPAQLYDPIAYFMQLGGKRLRPLLTLFSNWIYTGEIEAALKPSLGLEVFHNFTLMHDDIMDKAPLRRNQQTVHEKWNANVAILSGDVMLVKAYSFFTELEPSLARKVLIRFNQVASEVCEGQQLDVDFEQQPVKETDYIEMIRLKTAVLIGFALELGAILAGADSGEAEKLRKAGENIGLSFQLKDDLLDVYGDQSKFGKQVGGDIVSGKKTILLVKALEKSRGELLKQLRETLSDKKVQAEEKVRIVTGIYDRLGLKREVQNLVDEYLMKGLRELSAINASFFRKKQLSNFLLQLAQRER